MNNMPESTEKKESHQNFIIINILGNFWYILTYTSTVFQV